MGISRLTSDKNLPSVYSKSNSSLCQNWLRLFTFTLSMMIHLATKELKPKSRGLILDSFIILTCMTSGHQILLVLPPICRSCFLLSSLLSLTS